MDFRRTEEQLAIQALVKKIFQEEVTEESLRALEQEGSWHHDGAWDALKGSGLLGLCLPEEFGGAGLSFFDLCLVLEQVGRNVVPIPLYTSVVLGALPILQFGSQEQKEGLLPGIADGSILVTAALQEPGLVDLKRPQASATKTANGWSLRGTKHCVPGLKGAQKVLVSATTQAGTPALFLVDPGLEGVHTQSQTSIRREPLGHMRLDDVIVSEDAILGSPSAQVLPWTFAHASTALCAVHLGVARQALILTGKYTGERHQFGVPIASFQAVHQRAADAYIDVQSMELTLWQAAWKLSAGLDATRESAIARFWASTGGHRVVCAAQHLHGGMGYDCDYPLHRFFRWSKHLELQLGGPKSQLSDLGHSYLGR